MAAALPYTHYACPCSELSSAPTANASKRASIQPSSFQLNEDQTFNPHSPRANYALYPLEHLLYCDECDAIRCPRCWTEEVLYWYCPSCLFDVPTSNVRSDGNRCSRSCYNCPCCTAPLGVTQVTLPKDDSTLLSPSDAVSGNDAYTLHCQYCDWSSLEIGVHFSRATKITEQLAKQRKTGTSSNSDKEPPDKKGPSRDDCFTKLTTFYRDQLSESGDPQNPFSNSPYSSPANLARIMSLYGGLSHSALKKSREKPQPMREAVDSSEGLITYTADDSDYEIIDKVQSLGWDATTASEQQLSAPVNADARFHDQLWPTATPLRARCGKRCKTCRQFLARPEPKVGSLKYRIRLLALNHIPRLSVRLLQSTAPQINPAFHLRPDVPEPALLSTHETKQYILTIRNPIFETVKITLATPATTPGKVASRVTILCPSFTVGPAGDVWDEALSASTQSSADGGRKAAMASLTGSSESSDRQPEAGKVWEKTRNSTSVVVEIVPGPLKPPTSIVPKTEAELDEEEFVEDDDVLEIPIYLRAEWEAEIKPGESGHAAREADKHPGEKAKKEIGYWVVLGVGRIGP